MASRTQLPQITVKTVSGNLQPVTNATVNISKITVVGSTTPTLYDSATGVGTIANPMTSDVEGRLNAWVPYGTYDLHVTAAGVDATIRFDALPTTSLTQDVLNLSNVREFGAKGDGTTDDTSAIAAAATAAGSGVLLFPPGDYVTTQQNFTAGLKIFGSGPERTTIRAKTGSTGPLFNAAFSSNTPNFQVSDLLFQMSAAKTIDCIYADNGNKALFQNLKFRYGRRGLSLGNMDQTIARDIWGMNQTDAVVYVDDPALNQPNVMLKNIYGEITDSLITMQAVVWINSFCSGLSINDVWAVVSFGTGACNAGIRFDSPSAPSGVLGHFALCTGIVTDGITGPGVLANNCRQLQISNSFLGSHPSANSSGLKVTGTCRDFILSNNWISGSGIELTSTTTLNQLQVENCNFPQTVSGGAFIIPSGATLSNWRIASNNHYSTAMTPDDTTLNRILAASDSKGYGNPTQFIVSDQAASQRLVLYNPNSAAANRGRQIGLSSSASGPAIQFVRSNGINVPFTIGDDGITITGNNSVSGTQIKRHLSFTAAWTPGTVPNTGTVTTTLSGATGAVLGDVVTPSFSLVIADGVFLFGNVTAADTIKVTLINLSGSQITLGAGTVRTDIWQH